MFSLRVQKSIQKPSKFGFKNPWKFEHHLCQLKVKMLHFWNQKAIKMRSKIFENQVRSGQLRSGHVFGQQATSRRSVWKGRGTKRYSSQNITLWWCSAVSFYQQVLRLKAFGPHHIIIVDLSKSLLFQLWFYFSQLWSKCGMHSIRSCVWSELKCLISKVQSNEERLREHPAKDERLDSMSQKGALFCCLLS